MNTLLYVSLNLQKILTINLYSLNESYNTTYLQIDLSQNNTERIRRGRVCWPWHILKFLEGNIKSLTIYLVLYCDNIMMIFTI